IYIPRLVGSMIWNRTRTHLLYSIGLPNFGQALYIRDWDTQDDVFINADLEIIHENYVDLYWSPNNSHIAFESFQTDEDTSSYQISVLDVDTGEVIQITTVSGSHQIMGWLPCSQ
ncbi:MAG: hypothetical protein AAFR67_17615, partial [Chloroflexota bacterium]